MLYIAILVVLIVRFSFFILYGTSRNVGFLIPLFLECLFIYPFVLVDFIGLEWSFYALITLYIPIICIQVGLIPLLDLPLTKVVFEFKFRHILFFVFLSIVFYGVGVVSNFSQADLFNFSISNYLQISNNSALDRYSGEQNLSLLYKIGSIFAYFSAFMLGFILAVNKSNITSPLRYTWALIVLLFFIALLDSFLMAARAGMMMMTFCFISSYIIVSQVKESGRAISLSTKTILKLAFALIVVFLFFLIIQIFRGGKEDFDLIGILSHLITWFVGHIPVFSIWIENIDLSEQPQLGVNTFAGISDLIGFKERNIGIYEGVNIGNGRISNIYTALRPIIEDITIFGMAVLYVSFGLSISVLIKTRNIKTKKLFTFLCIAITIFLLWSFVTSIFVYNTILVALFIFSFVSYYSVRIKIETL
ncbi:oligosaccharide repeat unit polymerase [Aeromonas sp. FDAARGOS 1409]|uniref:O-antigen polymerase n=1 Tax=Aeromonas sp. FDAARGOS 1409 TaxID=2778058 RepID=UPI001C22F991|nr:O-antigen polymerase [Aeromonas sp. FDAARGOS 1409]QXC30077.1 oligosaccharide repeat unit polymerase [Aeromonas sp. FDAARGOS 1409]